MLDYANPVSINDNLEQFGIVVTDPETGDYYITTPVAGEEHSVPRSAIESVNAPEGMEVVAWYHTHGADQPEYADHQFSENDKNFTENGAYGSVGYLGTPDGTYRKYDADTDSDTELPR